MTRYLRRIKDSGVANDKSPPSLNLTPLQVCKAYEFQKLTPIRPIKMGIVSLGGCFSSTDMKAAFEGYQLPLPTLTVAGTQDPADELATLENMLDIECLAAAYSYSTNQPAKILEQFDALDEYGMARAITALVKAGCEVISISWGWPTDEQPEAAKKARAQACAEAAAANCHIFTASGDNSMDDGTESPTPDDPCCDPNVWGVGGTSMVLNSSGEIASESAWGDGNANDIGGGGGFDKEIPIPPYQIGVVPGQYRGCPDSSAHANPGYSFFALGKWQVMGGTSASAPITAGYVAAILSTLPQPISQTDLQSLLYKNIKSAFNDITTGSNGYPATVGWDPATGCGSINGPGMLKALTDPGLK